MIVGCDFEINKFSHSQIDNYYIHCSLLTGNPKSNTRLLLQEQDLLPIFIYSHNECLEVW